MSSHSDHARLNLCRNRLTRSPWAWPLLLLIASPLSRSLAVGGTLLFGTGCSEPSYDDCEQWRTECIDVCAPDDAECLVTCETDYDLCIEEAYLAQERHAERVDAIADASVACFAVALCTLESLGDPDSEDEDDWSQPEPEPEPVPNDDWGEDWGEQTPSEELEVFPPEQWTDLPEE
jgi:hypothetical protein